MPIFIPFIYILSTIPAILAAYFLYYTVTNESEMIVYIFSSRSNR